MNDLISRQAAIDAVNELTKWYMEKYHETRPTTVAVIDRLMDLPSAQQWIPFTIRPCTEQEKEEHPDWGFYIDCQLPDDGDAILISTKSEYVCADEIFCEDDCWYLDSGYVIGEEAVAWMPLPEPYKEENKDVHK